ncbi:hypothetical protein G4V62_13415 [Bacillaceae bacterium SIJ1]|uniref:hypothetical protein n=1 Tax=Litoribacterium kuwaitense TaxID=1398745 RepID=UPI0013EB092D|nr:hypothetical protein [Litoribacterium kuwaitense]NGP45896.1 hypothetical protein [Litoribacterium kuwaitense]
MLERFIRSPFQAAFVLFLVMSNVYLAYKQVVWVLIFSLIAFVYVALYVMLIVIYNRQQPKRRISFLSFVPYELHELDEGQQWVVNKALP